MILRLGVDVLIEHPNTHKAMTAKLCFASDAVSIIRRKNLQSVSLGNVATIVWEQVYAKTRSG